MKMGRFSIVILSFALSCSVAFAQHGRSGGGSGNSSAGSMGSTMSGGHDAMGASAADRGMSNAHSPSSTAPSVNGKSSPDEILSRNTKLSSNLDKLLPAGMTAQQACSGFKNLGQCVAAIHVAHNLDIPFADLKAKMTGGDNLGKAIQDLKPTANAKAESKKAKKQAEADLNAVNS